jgi:hypothetical protein
MAKKYLSFGYTDRLQYRPRNVKGIVILARSWWGAIMPVNNLSYCIVCRSAVLCCTAILYKSPRHTLLCDILMVLIR